MMLYDIYYHGNAMDSCVPLPGPKPDMKLARNVNWDGHKKVVVKVGPKQYEWQEVQGRG